jgi:HTH-type transcriptional regulator/antitoxin HigA
MDEGAFVTDVAATKREWTPNWAIHPGTLLEEHLEARGISQAEFARLAGITPKLVSTIIKGLNPVTAETAIRFERVLGLKAYIWTGIQAKWDLFQARADATTAPDAKSSDQGAS